MVRIAICDDDKTAVLLHENVVAFVVENKQSLLIRDFRTDWSNYEKHFDYR